MPRSAGLPAPAISRTLSGVSHTYTQLLYHLVFSTKGRRPCLDPAWRPQFCDYLAGMVRQKGGVAYGINGAADHLHLLLRLHQDWALADLMREWKAYGSRWVHEHVPGAGDFAWQAGYSAFSVSHAHRNRVAAYIAQQEAHHATTSFADELAALLRQHGIEPDHEQQSEPAALEPVKRT